MQGSLRRVRVSWLGLAAGVTGLLALVPACAPTSTAVCDYVFFAAVNCREPVRGPLIASRTNTVPVTSDHTAAPSSAPAPVASAQEPAPAAKPPEPAPAPEQPVAAGEDDVPPPINTVYFDIGKSTLTPGSKNTLERVAKYLKAAKTDTIKLTAFTDPIGKYQTNVALANQRAKVVSDELSALGVDNGRVSVGAFNLPKNSTFPKDEYWRLRKVVLFYSAETMARLEKHEREEEERSDQEFKTEVKQPRLPTPKPVGKQAIREAAANPPGDENKLENIDIIYWRNPNHALLILAKKLGFFEQEGFNVRLHESQLEANEMSIKLADEVGPVNITSPRSAMDVKSKRYFMGAVCPYGFHEALSKKLPFVAIGSLLTIPNTVIMKKENVTAALKDISKFTGTIGRIKKVTSDIQAVYLFTDRLRQAGRKEGVDWKFQFFETEQDMMEALFKGEITAAMSGPPWDLDAIKSHPGFGILPVSALNMNLPCCRQVVTRENLKRNRPKYVRFERALIRAQHYLVDHPAEAIPVIAKYLKLDPSVVRSIFQRPGFQLSANPNVRGEIAFANVMKTRIGEARVGDIRESTDTSVYEDALVQVIKENPNDPIYKAMSDAYNRTK